MGAGGFPWFNKAVLDAAWPNGFPIFIAKATVPPGNLALGRPGILTLNSLCYPVIAGVPGKIISPLAIFCVMRPGSIAYTSGGGIALFYTQSSFVSVGFPATLPTILVTSAGPALRQGFIPANLGIQQTAQTGIGVFVGNGGGSEYATGNGNLDVYVPYFLADA